MFQRSYPASSQPVPGTPAELRQLLKCDEHSTWTDAPAGHEDLPINCVSWRLAYPWGQWAPVDCTCANTELEAQSSQDCPRQPWPVGKARSRARWGHADLAGNLAEWIQDEPAPQARPGIAQAHLVQNASWNLHPIEDLESTHKTNPFPTQADDRRPAVCEPDEACDVFVSMTPPGWQVSSSIGFRCARVGR